MKLKTSGLFFLVFLFSSIVLGQSPYNYPFQNGVSFMAPPSQFSEDPMIELSTICPDWVALIPYAFVRSGGHTVEYDTKNMWWGERMIGQKETLKHAKKSGQKILLKPQIWLMDGWIGDWVMNEDEVDEFIDSYSQFVLHFIEGLGPDNIDMICIATEFKKILKTFPNALDDLINMLRKRYSIELIYAANWDNYQNIPIWDKLDYIGINSYFPLTDDREPRVKKLLKLWEPIRFEIENYACAQDKNIWFTEYGYLALDGTAGKTWLLEKKRQELPVNELAQANALEAFYQTWKSSSVAKGGFLWKWINQDEHPHGITKDYSPHNKLAAEVLAKHFCD